ncbi:hypothetical protein G6F64_013660 [Rhizopus arrhizus]|uniref:Uncharacterized protein n=1 Tax=Rhizopus oryzae TaxID=64495 RepID=A0A9P6WUY7_RHIOR|nr:hypothetical protein G6F64_013660 [Rhizopus arrhizus]
MRGAIRMMGIQPVAEQRCHFQRQAQQHVASGAGASIMRGLQHGFQFAVVDPWNHRRHHHPDRNAGLMQPLHRAQPCMRCRCARFQLGREMRVQRGHRELHADQVFRGQRCKQIDVALDQCVLGDQRERMFRLQHHFDQLAGQLELAFDRLVRVGVDAQRDRLWHVSRLRQLLAQQLRRIGLGEQRGLEIQAR